MSSATIRVAAFAGLVIAIPLSFAAGAWVVWSERPQSPPVLKVYVDPTVEKYGDRDRAEPQFDSGDSRFSVDPDGTDDQGRSMTCPEEDDCNGPDDSDQAVIRT
jgi:hypothetical protein